MRKTVLIQILQCSSCEKFHLGVMPGPKQPGQRITGNEVHCEGVWNIVGQHEVGLATLEKYARPGKKPNKKTQPNKKARQ